MSGGNVEIQLFHGGESFLVDAAFDSAWTGATSGMESELDREFLDPGASIDDVVASLSSVGFFSPTRVVGIRDWKPLLPKVGGGRRSKKDAADDPATRAAEVLAGLPAGGVLLLSASATVAASNPLLKLARSIGKVLEFPKLRGGDLGGWAAQRSRKLGIDIEPGALRLLVESVGDDLRELDAELHKLEIYAGGRAVKRADVVALVPDTAEHQVWDITDSLLSDPGRAAIELDRALAAGEPPPRLSYMLVRHLRLLLSAKAVPATDAGARRLTEVLSEGGRPVSEYVVKKAIQQARNVDQSRLESLYRRAASSEALSRKGELEEVAALRLLVVQAALTAG